MPVELQKKYRIRIENCIGTIIDVHNTVSTVFENHDLVPEFENLKEAVRNLDMDTVCEGDVLMVEKATNILLKEFKSVFESGSFGPVYEHSVC